MAERGGWLKGGVVDLSRLITFLISLPSSTSTDTSSCGPLLTSYKATMTYLGCYSDNADFHTLQGLSSAPDSLNSPQYCADLCGGLGYEFAGAETA